MPLIVKSSSVDADDSCATAAADAADLVDRLASHDVDTRRAAVRDAARNGDVDLLVRHLGLEADRGVRETIFTSLVRIGGTRAARPLAAMLRDGADAQLRNTVIEALQGLGEAAVPEIEHLLEDDDPDIRIYAINALQSLQSAAVPDIALRVVRLDPHINVCAAAVDVLAEVGRPDMADTLRAAAARFPGKPFLDFAVRAAIKRIG